MKTLTHKELIEKIRAIQGTGILGLLTFTDARARQTDNPYGKIFKQVYSVAIVGANYENSVNRELMNNNKAPKFEAESLPWGQWLIPGKVIEHKGEFYLRTQTTPGKRGKQPSKVLNYRNSAGEFLAKNAVAPFLPEKKDSRKQSEAGLVSASTMVDDSFKQVWVNDYKFSSIQKIKIAGEIFEIIHPEKTEKPIIIKPKATKPKTKKVESLDLQVEDVHIYNIDDCKQW